MKLIPVVKLLTSKLHIRKIVEQIQALSLLAWNIVKVDQRRTLKSIYIGVKNQILYLLFKRKLSLFFTESLVKTEARKKHSRRHQTVTVTRRSTSKAKP